MATASVPNPNFVNGSPADADQVDANFAALVSFLNGSVVHRDGSKAMTAAFDAGTQKIINVSAGTVAADAVNKGQLDVLSAAVDTDFVTYSPVLTEITIGNGTQVHKWRKLGAKTILVSNVITLGSTTVIGAWPRIAPPATLDTAIGVIGTMTASDVAPGNNYGGGVVANGASQVGGITYGTNGLFTFTSATHPFTWATGDVYRLTYIAQIV